MKKRFTPAVLEIKKPESGRLEIRDTDSPLVLRVTSAGARSFTVRTRRAGASAPARYTYPRAVTVENLSDARAWARAAVDKAKAGVDPREDERQRIRDAERKAAKAKELRFDVQFAEFVKRHASKNRTGDEAQRVFDVYLPASWKDRPIDEITRREVVALLDRIHDGEVIGPSGKSYGGPVMANRVLAQVRKFFNWAASRGVIEATPTQYVQGPGKEQSRDRVLSDDEIRVVWPLLDSFGTFGGLCKMLFLTAQRRGEVALLDRKDIDAEGVWTIAKEDFKNGRAQHVPLTESALAVIAAQRQLAGSTLVFTTNGQTPFSGFAKSKAMLDSAITDSLRKQASERGGDPAEVQPLPNWTLHDIRRTARSLMARAGVQPHIAERVIGHVIAGVEGVYDRHVYMDEKRAALEKLAALLERIVNPPAATSNVVTLQRAEA